MNVGQLKVYLLPVTALCSRCRYPMTGEVPRGEIYALLRCLTSDCPERERIYRLELEPVTLDEFLAREI